MKTSCRLIASPLLLAFAASVWAAPAAPPPAAPPDAATAQAGPSAQPILDKLIGKKGIVRFTENSGRQFLGRVVSGDHGLYVVQTFHYITAPATITQTTPKTTVIPGRRGRVRGRTKNIKTRETTRNVIPDAVAIPALLRGVGGSSFRPTEQPAGREMVAPTDIKTLQALHPPRAAQALAPAPAGQPAPTPSTAPNATAPAGMTSADWKLKTLWPLPE